MFFNLFFSRDTHKRCDRYVEISYVICPCRQQNLLSIRFQSASNPLPIRIQSASNPLPICFQSASNPLPRNQITYGSGLGKAIYLRKPVRKSKFHAEAAHYSYWKVQIKTRRMSCNSEPSHFTFENSA
jgi:hypothetical protein